MKKETKEDPTWIKAAKKIIEDKKKIREVIVNGGDIRKIEGIEFINPSKI